MIVTACPNCGAQQELHIRFEEGQKAPGVPSAGSASLCVACLGFSIFEVDSTGLLYRRKPSNDEFRDLLGDENVMQVFATAALLKRGRKNLPDPLDSD